VNVYLDKEYPGEYEDNRHLTFPGGKVKILKYFQEREYKAYRVIGGYQE
jgi:hypothetical protein